MSDANPSNSSKPGLDRYFYTAATALLLILTVAGFQLFYFHGKAYPGRPLTPPIRALLITHSVAMSLWMLLALAQPWLIVNGRRRLHMALGRIGAVLAACLAVLGVKLGVAAARVAPPGLMFGPLTSKQFMAVPVLDILLFAAFVVAGVVWRKRPERHRPIMFMATLTAVAAAISRIDFFNHLYAGTIWQKIFGDLFFTLVVGGVLLLAKCLAARKIDRWFAACYGVMILWYLLIVHGARTSAWDQIATFLLARC